MPYKDKAKRYEAIRKSVAKKPKKYRALRKEVKRRAARRGYHIQKRYGISMMDYMDMLTKQDNACAICKKPSGLTVSGRPSLYVDHDHKTGKVRGLLCARCNMLMSFLDQDNWVNILCDATAYHANNTKTKEN